jgi:hypothetical protein
MKPLREFLLLWRFCFFDKKICFIFHGLEAVLYRLHKTKALEPGIGRYVTDSNSSKLLNHEKLRRFIQRRTICHSPLVQFPYR